MKFLVLFLIVFVVLVECTHVFLGTNVQRPLVHHEEVKYHAQVFRKRIEYFTYTLPSIPNQQRYIQGIMAYDMTNSGASVNVTEGGIGANMVKLRMKSDRGEPLHYDIYIYV
uniref:Cadherin domain-containing protein n=1 Tax=Pectinophora gossypiella TaxID=13191 RepID=A0A1E1WSD0_PECGO